MKKIIETSRMLQILLSILFAVSVAKAEDFSVLNDTGYITVFSVYTDLAFRKEGILAVEFQNGIPFIRDLVLYDTHAHFELNDIQKTTWNQEKGILKIKFNGSNAVYVYNLKDGRFSKRFGGLVQFATSDLGHYAARTGLEYVSRIALDAEGIPNNSFMRSQDKRNNLERGWNVVGNQFENRSLTFDNRFENQKFGFKEVPISIKKDSSTGNTEISVGDRLVLVVEPSAPVGIKTKPVNSIAFMKAQDERVLQLRNRFDNRFEADALIKFNGQPMGRANYGYPISVVFGYDRNFYGYLGLEKVAPLSLVPHSFDAITGAGYELRSEQIKAGKFTAPNFNELVCRELFN